METQTEYNVSSHKPNLDELSEKIVEIIKASATGNYIYRGEPALHQEPPYNGKVTSGLYRQYIEDIETEYFDVAVVQADILRAAHDYTPHKMEDFELLATLQHFGDKTNLIDFTTNYLVALFFACDRNFEEPGRVILLQRQPEGDPKPYEAKEPPITIGRAEAQKRIFVQAPKGFVQPDRIVTIPAHLKAALLEHLRKHHDISTKTIYSDLHGFIENRGVHKNADTAFCTGFTCQGRSEYDKAIEHYTTAIALNPGFTAAYNNRGLAYCSKSDLDAAIQDFNTAIELDPENAWVYRNRGSAYHSKSDLDAAIQDFNTAIELDPGNAWVYRNRGSAYRSKGDFDAAIQDYSKAIALAPEDADVYSFRGLAYCDKGDFDTAIENFNTAIELDPEHTWVYYNRGSAYRDKGDLDAAIENFNTAIELDPEDAWVYSNRGDAYTDKGEFHAAIQDYNKAIELDPQHTWVYYNRGEAWLHLKEWQKAKADLTTAKDMGFDLVEAFHNDHESVEAFAAKLCVKVPEDIAALLQLSL